MSCCAMGALESKRKIEALFSAGADMPAVWEQDFISDLILEFKANDTEHTYITHTLHASNSIAHCGTFHDQ